MSDKPKATVKVEHEGKTFEIQLMNYIFREEAREVGITGERDVRHFSCVWYFCRCAVQVLESTPQQVTLEDEVDATDNLRQLFDSIRRAYYVPDINDAVRFFPIARTLAFRRTLPWPSRFQAWIDSGGHSYNEVTREPDALNIN